MQHRASSLPKDHTPVKVVIRDGWLITVPASGYTARTGLRRFFRWGRK